LASTALTNSPLRLTTNKYWSGIPQEVITQTNSLFKVHETNLEKGQEVINNVIPAS